VNGLLIDEITGDHECGFRRTRSATDQFFAFIRYRKNLEYKETGGKYLQYSLRVWSTLETGRLIKMYLSETYGKFRIGKHICLIIFLSKKGLKEGCSITTAFQLCFRQCH
jgi:hypothetical protein